MLFSNYFQSILGVFCLVRTVSYVGFNPEVSAADNIGRRPVVLWGVASLAIVTIMFGLSPNFTTVIIARALGASIQVLFCVIMTERFSQQPGRFLGMLQSFRLCCVRSQTVAINSSLSRFLDFGGHWVRSWGKLVNEQGGQRADDLCTQTINRRVPLQTGHKAPCIL